MCIYTFLSVVTFLNYNIYYRCVWVLVWPVIYRVEHLTLWSKLSLLCVQLSKNIFNNIFTVSGRHNARNFFITCLLRDFNVTGIFKMEFNLFFLIVRIQCLNIKNSMIFQMYLRCPNEFISLLCTYVYVCMCAYAYVCTWAGVG